MKSESRRACRFGLDCKIPQCRFAHPKWNCSVCTYLNPWEEPDCLMCTHPHVKTPVSVHVPNTPSQTPSQGHFVYHPPPQTHPAPEPDLLGDWKKRVPASCDEGLPPCPNGQHCTIRTIAHTSMFSHVSIIDHNSKIRSHRKKPILKPQGFHPQTSFRSIPDISPDLLMDVSSLDDLEEPSLSRRPSIPDHTRGRSEEAMDPLLLGRSVSACTPLSLPNPLNVFSPRAFTEPTRGISPPSEKSSPACDDAGAGNHKPTQRQKSHSQPRQGFEGPVPEDSEAIETSLWRAVDSGDSDTVNLLIKAHEHLIKCADAQGNTPIIRAAKLGHLHLVVRLLDTGASVNEINRDGFSPLLAAALNGHEPLVQLLLDRGTDIEQRCKASYTALHCACFRGHLSTVKLLVERNANMEHIAKGGMTPLLFSAFAKHAYTVQYLVSQGADVKVCDAAGRSVLDLAATNSEIKFALDTGLQLWQHRREEHRKKQDEANRKLKTRHADPIKSPVQKAGPTKTEAKSLNLDIAAWTEHEVRQWLDEQNFSHYAASFCENMINGEMLLSLTEAELEQDLKIVNRLHRRRLLLEIGKLAIKAQAIQNVGKSRESEPLTIDPPKYSEQFKAPMQEYGTKLLSSPQPAGIAVFQASDFSEVQMLAKGEFSSAFAAVLTTKNDEGDIRQEKVVIKLPIGKPGPNEWNELNTFLNVPHHPNMLPFLGICKDFQYPERKSSFCIITKRQAGSIKDVLINSKHSEFDLPVNKLRVIHEFASGLAHLHAYNVIHRDIASRNILISYSGVAVVCDFGLSRAIDPQPDEDVVDAVNFKETYYRVSQQQMLPVRWMAPESLNSGKFSRKSDVWMFGVTVWQVLTSCDQTPYESLATANQVIVTVCTGQGGPLLLESLSHLPACLHALRDLVSQCLQVRPSDRPTMAQCCQLIKSLQDSITNNSNNLPSSLSDLAGWSKVTKQKPKKVEPAAARKAEKVGEKPTEKVGEKANGTSKHAVANTRKSNEKPSAKPEKGPVAEVQKPKNHKFSAVGNNKGHKGNPKKEPDYDELLIPFDDDEPG